MEKFFHKYFRGLHHHFKKFEKHFLNQDTITKFFASKNVRLAVILIIAAAIPLTVLGVQQIQDIRQNAAGNPGAAKGGKDCSAEAGSAIIADPLAPETNSTITFRRASGSFSQEDFDTGVELGNGVDSNKCDFSGGEFKNCPTKKSTTKDITVNGEAKKGTAHTIKDHGTPVCEYFVILKETKPKPTKDTTKPTKPDTPRATTDPAKNCQANLSTGSCTADNKPRLRASWQMKDEGKGCSIKVAGIEVSTECANSNKDITDLDGKSIENGKTYEIVISNGGSCNGAKTPASAKAPSCSGATAGKDPAATPTPKKGSSPTATPTPKPQSSAPPPVCPTPIPNNGAVGAGTFPPNCVTPTPTKVPLNIRIPVK